MGCQLSGDAQEPSAEGRSTRTKFDKATGEIIECEDGSEKPDTALFEAVDAGEGEQFMAVKPWIGAVKEPTNHPPPNPSPPDVNYTLEYVYGYRCEDSRQNVYFNSAGQAVYMTAALGVILNQSNNTQTFFCVGQVDMRAKNVSDDT